MVETKIEIQQIDSSPGPSVLHGSKKYFWNNGYIIVSYV